MAAPGSPPSTSLVCPNPRGRMMRERPAEHRLGFALGAAGAVLALVGCESAEPFYRHVLQGGGSGGATEMDAGGGGTGASSGSGDGSLIEWDAAFAFDAPAGDDDSP